MRKKLNVSVSGITFITQSCKAVSTMWVRDIPGILQFSLAAKVSIIFNHIFDVENKEAHNVHHITMSKVDKEIKLNQLLWLHSRGTRLSAAT